MLSNLKSLCLKKHIAFLCCSAFVSTAFCAGVAHPIPNKGHGHFVMVTQEPVYPIIPPIKTHAVLQNGVTFSKNGGADQVYLAVSGAAIGPNESRFNLFGCWLLGQTTRYLVNHRAHIQMKSIFCYDNHTHRFDYARIDGFAMDAHSYNGVPKSLFRPGNEVRVFLTKGFRFHTIVLDRLYDLSAKSKATDSKIPTKNKLLHIDVPEFTGGNGSIQQFTHSRNASNSGISAEQDALKKWADSEHRLSKFIQSTNNQLLSKEGAMVRESNKQEK